MSNSDNNPSQRRRMGRIVHDERGTASVEWHDAPADEVRTKLEVEGGVSTGRGTRDPFGADMLSIERPKDTFDPYQRSTAADRDRKSTGNTTKTDLRKLSEWIKLMRALEEQKKNGGGGDE